MKLIANIIGATGLVGRELVIQLIEHPYFEQVRIFVRRTSGIKHPKLEEKIIDFSNPEIWKNQVTGNVLFSALGTTLKQAGSKEKEYEVDYTYNLRFAKTALENGITDYILVSSAGANPKSPIFYARMKGQLDDTVMNMGFPKTVILRPSILDGNRTGKRTAEKYGLKLTKMITRFVFKKYRPIHGSVVARAMINAAVQLPGIKGCKIFTLDEIFRLAAD